MSEFNCFLGPSADHINGARQNHLASFGIPLDNKKVLEVGAGIGLHTPFFLQRGCTVVITDGFPNNVAEIKRRHPALQSMVLDLEKDEPLNHLGSFDIVYCYGLLYHLKNAETAIARLAEICTGQILLETICSLAKDDSIDVVKDGSGNNQSIIGVGCRPSRRWVLNRLTKYFGHAYISKTQPDHHDFPTNWDVTHYQHNSRAIFVGSKYPIASTELLTEPLSKQETYKG